MAVLNTDRISRLFHYLKSMHALQKTMEYTYNKSEPRKCQRKKLKPVLIIWGSSPNQAFVF